MSDHRGPGCAAGAARSVDRRAPARSRCRPMPERPLDAHRPEQSYPLLPTAVDPRSDSFRANREANLAALERVEAALAAARAGGGEKYAARHLAKGKLLPRQRVELLLDR